MEIILNRHHYIRRYKSFMKYKIAICFVGIVCILFQRCQENPSKKVFFASFIFEDNFNNDIVSLAFSGHHVVQEDTISTIPQIGVTNLRLDFYQKGSDICVEDMQGEEIFRISGTLTESSSFDVTLNGNLFKYSIDTLKGKYLYFSKVEHGKLKLIQDSLIRYYE